MKLFTENQLYLYAINFVFHEDKIITNSENSIIHTKYSALVHIKKVHGCEIVLVREFPRQVNKVKKKMI